MSFSAARYVDIGTNDNSRNHSVPLFDVLDTLALCEYLSGNVLPQYSGELVHPVSVLDDLPVG